MALKFLYITTDPFVNNTQEFVRILAVEYFPGLGSGFNVNGQLFDQSGNVVSAMFVSNGEFSTEVTAYPYAFSGTYQSSQIIIVPPGWSFRNFGRAIGVQGSLEEVLRVS